MRWPDTGELMAWLNQVAQITLINLQNVPRRLGTSLVVVVGIAGVVGVLVSVLAMSEGFRHTLSSTGRSSRVMMLRAGSDAELSSGVARDQAIVLASLPAIARDDGGRPLASAEIVVMVDLPRKGQRESNNVPFRGVQPGAFAIRDELTLLEGRHFARGDVRFLRLGYRTLLAVAQPGYIVMRLGAQWIYSKEHLDDAPSDPTWIGIGFIVADLGALLVLIALIVGGIGVRRLDSGGGQGLLKAAMVIAWLVLAAALVAVWAMAGKPD